MELYPLQIPLQKLYDEHSTEAIVYILLEKDNTTHVFIEKEGNCTYAIRKGNTVNMKDS